MGSILSCLLTRRSPRPKVLFLTTQPPAEIKAEWPYYQNWFLPELVRKRGADVQVRCWRDAALDAVAVSKYDAVTFLWCNNYHAHPIEFPDFVGRVLIPAQEQNPRLDIFNDPATILWNCDKHYLLQLAAAGFVISKSKFIDSSALTYASLASAVQDFSDTTAVILKPAISGSARGQHLIRDPQDFSTEDEAFIDSVVTHGVNGDLILQEFEESISAGEYSLVFINGRHTHTILKVPHGDYRCQSEYGGSAEEVSKSDVPQNARDVAQQIVRYIGAEVSKNDQYYDDEGSPLVYARVDGIMRGDQFVLMEVEAVEPHLWLEAKSGSLALDELCNVFFRGK
ncbi:MAG: hypothetical protein HETSPECPRED_000007 [Heterodermia speciosa]|uniref:ATP-grasp domain-containing protein n=1 Tax=Heterodermia speciosa TaxID=116794 RepID=A0A8H3ECN0_9LECA|nr:MAG: hypothetical protein HETSPECPRED_000007 [Heterodermia speciosa]